MSAWYNRDFKGQDYGLVHWVAVRPAYQRRGLGKAGLSFTLNKMAQWHDRSYLNTSIKRLPAVKLYLNFGFMPDLHDSSAVEKWLIVKDKLNHPSLEKVL